MSYLKQLLIGTFFSPLFLMSGGHVFAQTSDSNMCKAAYHECNNSNWEVRTAQRANCKQMTAVEPRAQCLSALKGTWEVRENSCRAQKETCRQSIAEPVPANKLPPLTTILRPEKTEPLFTEISSTLWSRVYLKCANGVEVEIARQIYKGRALRIRRLVTQDTLFQMGFPAEETDIQAFVCGENSKAEGDVIDTFRVWISNEIRRKVFGLKEKCAAGANLPDCYDIDGFRKRLLAVFVIQ